MRKEVAYLGHIVSGDGIKPNPNKLNGVKNYLIPKTQDEIKNFRSIRILLDIHTNFCEVDWTQYFKKGSKIEINKK